ncbi:MAG: hypothetical protein MSH38_05575, partial [Eubacterium sp.]|nr:hypothetical protein [Eubacterium sp.]
FSAVCIAAVIGMILSLVLTGGKSEQKEFVPPEFEPSAQEGVPTVADKSWTQIYKDGMSFSAHVCGKVIIENDSAELFLQMAAGIMSGSSSVFLTKRIIFSQRRDF